MDVSGFANIFVDAVSDNLLVLSRLDNIKADHFRQDRLLQATWSAFLGYIIALRTERFRREHRQTAVATAHHRFVYLYVVNASLIDQTFFSHLFIYAFFSSTHFFNQTQAHACSMAHAADAPQGHCGQDQGRYGALFEVRLSMCC